MGKVDFSGSNSANSGSSSMFKSFGFTKIILSVFVNLIYSFCRSSIVGITTQLAALIGHASIPIIVTILFSKIRQTRRRKFEVQACVFDRSRFSSPSRLRPRKIHHGKTKDVQTSGKDYG